MSIKNIGDIRPANRHFFSSRAATAGYPLIGIKIERNSHVIFEKDS
jgi:hypothetical protein